MLMVIDVGQVVRNASILTDDDRDARGCFRPGEYTWDEEVGACVGRGEHAPLTRDSRWAARLAVAHVGASRGLTVFDVWPITDQCDGCFHVVLERPWSRSGVEQLDVQLRDWKVVSDDGEKDLTASNGGRGDLTESKAIALLKIADPELKNYSHDRGSSPLFIRTEKDRDGWYVAFVRGGSGIPIIRAQCFFVRGDDTIHKIGEFRTGYDFDFPLKTCERRGPSTLPAAQTKWKGYSNARLGFSVSYPNDWEVKEYNENEIYISYSGWRQMPEGGGAVVIAVEDKTLEQFVEEYNSSDVLDDGTALSRIVKQEKYTLGGVGGYRLVGTTAIGIEQSFIFITRDNKAYIIRFHDYDDAHVDILGTFRFH